MLVYNQAFDMYHCVYRLVSILSYFNRGDYVEIERLRIWDYYLLFPQELKKIRLRRDEKEIKLLITDLINAQNTPYNKFIDNRKMFEKVRSYQMNALKCMASYGIINADFISTNRITKLSMELFEKYKEKFEPMRELEKNVIKLMTSHFYFMSLYGEYGLKQRTGLLEFKYDAK